jgi:hypothetical protein
MPGRHTYTRSSQVISLTAAGAGDEATAASQGLSAAADATDNPMLASYALGRVQLCPDWHRSRRRASTAIGPPAGSSAPSGEGPALWDSSRYPMKARQPRLAIGNARQSADLMAPALTSRADCFCRRTPSVLHVGDPIGVTTAELRPCRARTIRCAVSGRSFGPQRRRRPSSAG